MTNSCQQSPGTFCIIAAFQRCSSKNNSNKSFKSNICERVNVEDYNVTELEIKQNSLTYILLRFWLDFKDCPSNI